MEKFWTKALQVTGPVAVVGFILWFVLQQFFNAEVLSIFTSQQRFLITLIVMVMLLIIFFAAVLSFYSKKNPSSEAGTKTVNISNSEIAGDFVMGNKSEKSENDK